MWKPIFDWMNGTVAAIGQAQQATMVASLRTLELATNTYSKMWGLETEDVIPADRRFDDDAWRENIAADVMKQAYLITTKWMEGYANSLEIIDPDIHQRTSFWTKQLADGLSPTNFALTNPVVMQETIRTGGTNLLQGMQNLLSDMRKGRVARFQMIHSS